VLHDERVILVEQLIAGSKGSVKKLLNGVIGLPAIDHADPAEDAPRVGVHHEDGILERIEKDRISSLGPDAPFGKQSLA
jgi:hypothetical protein